MAYNKAILDRRFIAAGASAGSSTVISQCADQVV
jgi:hypothetical protein